MSTFLSILRLLRPLNLLITFLSILGATALAGAQWDRISVVLLAGLTGAFVAAGANAINDFFDVETDKINRPDRPLPSGELEPRHAYFIWMMTSLGGLVCGWFTGPHPFFIAVGAIGLLYVYSRSLKSTPLVGNVVVGFMTGLAFIFGAVAIGSPEAGVMPAVFAFLSNLAREVVKDVEDREGDRKTGAATFPLRFGLRKSRLIISFLLFILIAITLFAYAQKMYTETYLWLVLIADLFLAYVGIYVWRSDESRHMRSMSTMLKAAMVFGLAALYFGRI